MVYLEAANGVEMQFQLRDLEVDAPPPAGERPRAVAPMRAGALRPGVPPAPVAPPEPDPKHQALLTRLPESVVGQAAVRYARDPKTQRAGWLNLDPTEKLQWVGRVTGLTIEKLEELSRAGKSRQIEAHAAVASKGAR